MTDNSNIPTSRSVSEGRAMPFDPNINIQINHSPESGQTIEGDKKVVSKALSAFDRIAKKVIIGGSVNEIRQYQPAITETRQYQPNITEARQYSNSLAEAAQTREIQHPNNPQIMGVQRANFAVFPMPNNGKTRYDVVNMNDERKMVEGLCLNDSATAIVKLLNKGYSFYSPEVQTVLKLEETYTKHYNDAVSYQRKSGDPAKDAVRVTRFEESKHKFLTIKEELITFNKRLS